MGNALLERSPAIIDAGSAVRGASISSGMDSCAGAHATHECIFLDHLAPRTALLAAMISQPA